MFVSCAPVHCKYRWLLPSGVAIRLWQLLILTIPSCEPVNAALFSTKPDRFAISSFSDVMVSFAESPCLSSVDHLPRFFYLLRGVVMVCWSSCDSFRAAWTFDALF